MKDGLLVGRKNNEKIKAAKWGKPHQKKIFKKPNHKHQCPSSLLKQQFCISNMKSW